MSPQQRAQQVREAVSRLERRPGDWVPLADVREQLGGMSRAEQDEALKELAVTPGVSVIPWDNTKALRQRDRDASFDFGGENHAIRLEPVNPDESARRARQAFAELKSPNTEWVGLADIREKLEARGLSREQQDEAFRHMLRHDSDVRIIPVANTKALKTRDHQAALDLGGSPVHAMSIREENRAVNSPSSVREPWQSNRSDRDRQIELVALRDQLRVTTDARQRQAIEERISRLDPPAADGTPQGRAAQRLSSPRGSDLDAKRRRLAELDAASAASPDISSSRLIRQEADDLRRQIGRDERGDDAGKVDQPREATRAEVMQAYAELAQNPGDLVSLVRLRAKLGHIRHDELTAVLKEMDRARAIQLDPDPNRKALPPEAHEAAVTLGDDPKHFLSIAGVGGTQGRAAQRLRGSSQPSGWNASTVAQQLGSMTSVPDGKARLHSASKPQLQELAGIVGVQGFSSASKEQLIDRIVFMTIGARGAFRRALGEI